MFPEVGYILNLSVLERYMKYFLSVIEYLNSCGVVSLLNFDAETTGIVHGWEKTENVFKKIEVFQKLIKQIENFKIGRKKKEIIRVIVSSILIQNGNEICSVLMS